jgi:hypothetical protein
MAVVPFALGDWPMAFRREVCSQRLSDLISSLVYRWVCIEVLLGKSRALEVRSKYVHERSMNVISETKLHAATISSKADINF